MSDEEDGSTVQDSTLEPQVDRTTELDAVQDEPSPVDYQRYDCTTSNAAQLAEAAEAARLAIERGQCIVLPTDTVYGIGADAFSPEAVQRLLDTKVRGRDMPPPVLIADSSLIRVLAVDVPQQAKDLVAKHWPGPLTVICQVQPSLRLDLGEAEGTIALRVPDHELAREVLRRTGPMAVSSANISGLTAATTVDQAIEQLGDGVAVYLDGGRLGGVESAPSTIVDFSQTDTGEVLRHGALSVALLRETLPELADLVEPDPEGDTEPDTIAEAARVQEPDSVQEPAREAGDRDPTAGGDDTDARATPDQDDPAPRPPSEA